MKRTFAIISLLLALSLTAACGAAPSQPVPGSSSPASPAPEDSSPTITRLVIGLDDQFPPMGFRDEKNELVGFDIDLAKAVCDKLGIEAIPTPINWSSKEFELNGGKVDVLWNGLTITDARKEAMLMSPAYITNAQVIVVRKDSGIKTLADLGGKTVALQEGSSAEEAYTACAAAGTEKELIKAPENISLLSDLKIGRIDAVVIDKVFGDYYIAENGEGKLEVLAEQLADEEYGIAFRKENQELAALVLGALDELVKDGTAAQISQKWFGEDRIVFQYPG